MTAPHQPHAPGSVRVEQEEGGSVLLLTGDVDAATVAAYERTRAADGGGMVVAVDASRATFLNSTGVALLVRETQACRDAGRRPQLRSPSRQVRQVLALTGVETLFDLS